MILRSPVATILSNVTRRQRVPSLNSLRQVSHLHSPRRNFPATYVRCQDHLDHIGPAASVAQCVQVGLMLAVSGLNESPPSSTRAEQLSASRAFYVKLGVVADDCRRLPTTTDDCRLRRRRREADMFQSINLFSSLGWKVGSWWPGIVLAIVGR